MHGFSESIKRKVEGGMKGHDLVNEVLREWESIVNRVHIVYHCMYYVYNLVSFALSPLFRPLSTCLLWTSALS